MNYEIKIGDCIEILRTLPDASVDSIVTDPPYGLSKDPDIVEVLTKWIAGDKYEHASAGFMGKAWDSFVPSPEYWRECFRVLKQGGHLLAFAGSRTYDLMSVSIRMGGFEIRDQIMWLYGSGFPKSHNISKAIDKAAGAEREVVGSSPFASRKPNGSAGVNSVGLSATSGAVTTAPATDDAKRWDGWGTALKPAHEPIVMARKPFKGTVAANVLEHGTGAINIDGCRIHAGGESLARPFGSGGISAQQLNAIPKGTVTGDRQTGRFPANLTHDGSEAVLGIFPKTQRSTISMVGSTNRAMGGWGLNTEGRVRRGHEDDGGSAARYFYCAKASKRDRDEGLDARNNHPTVKPTDLMRYLCRLVTPPCGVVLDPFCGSGSTGKAAVLEGFRFVGIEREEEYARLAEARCEWAEKKAGVPPEDPREVEAQCEPAKLDRSQRNLFDESS